MQALVFLQCAAYMEMPWVQLWKKCLLLCHTELSATAGCGNQSNNFHTLFMHSNAAMVVSSWKEEWKFCSHILARQMSWWKNFKGGQPERKIRNVYRKEATSIKKNTVFLITCLTCWQFQVQCVSQLQRMANTHSSSCHISGWTDQLSQQMCACLLCWITLPKCVCLQPS